MDLLRLKEVMKQKEVTGIDLANSVGVTTTTISNVVKGNNFPKPDLLLAIAERLDVDIRELFHPTKMGTEGSLNGFIEYNSVIYKINSKEDLEKLLLTIDGE